MLAGGESEEQPEDKDMGAAEGSGI